MEIEDERIEDEQFLSPATHCRLEVQGVRKRDKL